MDAVFSPQNFKNEIIWQRTQAHGRAKKWGPIHDVLLFYTKSDNYLWNRILQPYDQSYLDSHYKYTDAHGVYRLVTLDGPGVRNGSSGLPWKNIDPTTKGRHWEIPPDRALPNWFVHPHGYSEMTVQERLDVLESQGIIYWPPRGNLPQYKRYLSASGGNPIQDIITDIDPLNSQADDRLGFPTQKPEALLDRIIAASSNEGDVVLDCFCGCGTTIASAQKLKRRWIGIDITNLAITLIRHRLRDAYGDDIAKTYKVIGEPVSVADAAVLAGSDEYQFQWWALGLVGARPAEGKKGADKGIDGRIYFHEGDTGKTKQIILSVKAGKLHAPYVRDLRGVIEREAAAIGVLVALNEPTKAMRTEAASAGFYTSPWGQHPRLQIVTVGELLAGKKLDIPPVRQTSVTYKRAPKAVSKAAEQQRIFSED